MMPTGTGRQDRFAAAAGIRPIIDRKPDNNPPASGDSGTERRHGTDAPPTAYRADASAPGQGPAFWQHRKPDASH